MTLQTIKARLEHIKENNFIDKSMNTVEGIIDDDFYFELKEDMEM